MEHNVLDYIGFFGPLFTFFISIYKLFNRHFYLFGYLCFVFLNTLSNHFLKTWIKQPRPEGGRNLIENEPYTGTNRYGMPSSHAQSVLFSTTFLWLVDKNPNWLIIEGFICALTLYQRWKFRRHSIEQLFVGSLAGISMAIFGVFMTERYIHNQ